MQRSVAVKGSEDMQSRRSMSITQMRPCRGDAKGVQRSGAVKACKAAAGEPLCMHRGTAALRCPGTLFHFVLKQRRPGMPEHSPVTRTCTWLLRRLGNSRALMKPSASGARSFHAPSVRAE